MTSTDLVAVLVDPVLRDALVPVIVVPNPVHRPMVWTTIVQNRDADPGARTDEVKAAPSLGESMEAMQTVIISDRRIEGRVVRIMVPSHDTIMQIETKDLTPVGHIADQDAAPVPTVLITSSQIEDTVATSVHHHAVIEKDATITLSVQIVGKDMVPVPTVPDTNTQVEDMVATSVHHHAVIEKDATITLGVHIVGKDMVPVPTVPDTNTQIEGMDVTSVHHRAATGKDATITLGRLIMDQDVAPVPTVLATNM